MFQVDRAFAACLDPVVPRAHQCVLENRKLVRVIADVIEQPLHQSVGHLAAADAGGCLDCLLTLASVQSWDDVFPFVDRFGQAAELCAIAEKIRAHGQYDIDGAGLLLAGFKE